MDSVTVEFQRFGDVTGVIRQSDHYIRTVGTSGPAEEVCFGLDQAALVKGMKTLGYDRFQRAGEQGYGAVRQVAEKFVADITPYLQNFLTTQPPPGKHKGRYQIDVVTRVLELAQLPFEALEETVPNIVITRRIRQPWPPPNIVRHNKPKVLFAWSAPKPENRTKRMKVPSDRHRDLLDRLLSDWGGFDGGAVVELEHVTRAKLVNALADPKHGYTHVHLLAHGVGPPPESLDVTAPVDLSAPPQPSTFLALEDENGTIDRCHPKTLGDIFLHKDTPRPASFAIATCHSGEIDSVESGGTLAHVLHSAGVPVVVGSQLALTQSGSDELIKTFLAKVVNGDDPREALGVCRDKLRKNLDQTYYDRVALVGYIHVDPDLEQRLPGRKFAVALARLEAASKDANRRVDRALPGMEDSGKGLSPQQHVEAEEIARRFASVRERLQELAPNQSLSKAQREELYGLQASSLKREAEAAWNLSRVLSGNNAQTWVVRSRDALRNAAPAYARAATTSRDHHWTWVQWLVLEAIVGGSLTGRENDWIASTVASEDAVQRKVPSNASDTERYAIAEQAIWARGSLIELCLLAPLVSRGDALYQAKEHAAELVNNCRVLGIDFPITSTLSQLSRYVRWWGVDQHWQLPATLVDQARQLHDHLMALHNSV